VGEFGLFRNVPRSLRTKAVSSCTLKQRTGTSR
jgi:hypothetical protein